MVLFSAFFGFPTAVAQEVQASLDTTGIKIGEQLIYRISVETGAEDLVVFPEGQTFVPMEMVESFPVDTAEAPDQLKVFKEYSLTQFDSGRYTIPQQRIQINDQTFFTDSLSVQVADVVVDTTKQKLYPIKPSVEPPSRIDVPQWVWWLLLIIVLGLLAGYFFRRKKKKEEAAKKLPPYEQAISELEHLDHSHLLENREIKEYYSQLTAAVRRYLDQEVYDHAMESTTNELILHIEAERKAGRLNVDDSTIERLKVILHRADLAKFANSKPDILTAREDRNNAEGIIRETKEGIPQPTEEELLQDQRFKERQEKRRKKRIIITAVAGVLLGLGIFTGYLVATQGFTHVKDTYLGHPTKKLLEGDWIRSEYGTPEIGITTPEVLRRGEVELPNEVKRMMLGSETFLYGNLQEEYFIGLTTLQLNQQSQFDLKMAVDGVYSFLEGQGARNILMKEENFTTASGVEGVKIFGSMVMEDDEGNPAQEKEYAILNFAEGGGFQQITLIYDVEDQYAEQITERILTSVELNNAGN